MQLQILKRKNSIRHHRRVGRGGKRGTYSGRGTKGQHARAGAKFRPQERDILKRIPKLRGYKFKSFQVRPAIVNFGDIDKKFKEGDVVSPESLHKAGLIRKIEGRIPLVKILGHGELKKKIEFRGVTFSGRASGKLNSSGFLSDKGPHRENSKKPPVFKAQSHGAQKDGGIK